MHTELSLADATIMTLALGETKIGACHIFTKCGVKVTTRGEQFSCISLFQKPEYFMALSLVAML